MSVELLNDLNFQKYTWDEWDAQSVGLAQRAIDRIKELEAEDERLLQLLEMSLKAYDYGHEGPKAIMRIRQFEEVARAAIARAKGRLRR